MRLENAGLELAGTVYCLYRRQSLGSKSQRLQTGRAGRYGLRLLERGLL